MTLILFVIGLLVSLVLGFVRMSEFLKNEEVFLYVLSGLGIILGTVGVGFCFVYVIF
mgnify:CR=1 FL=1|jgi:hypothetical protein